MIEIPLTRKDDYQNGIWINLGLRSVIRGHVAAARRDKNPSSMLRPGGFFFRRWNQVVGLD